MSTGNYLDRFLAPVADAFTPELARTVANIKADHDLQSYVDMLANKANDGSISDAEDAEYKTPSTRRRVQDAEYKTPSTRR